MVSLSAGLFSGLSAVEKLSRCNDEPMGDIGRQQHRLWRSLVFVVCRVLIDFRADADPQSDARLLVHARRIFRGQPDFLGSRFLASGDTRWTWCGSVRRIGRAASVAPAARG